MNISDLVDKENESLDGTHDAVQLRKAPKATQKVPGSRASKSRERVSSRKQGDPDDANLISIGKRVEILSPPQLDAL